MKGLILCAGYGKRLRPLTFFKPKCMIEVAGKPVLEHIVNYLKKYGVDEIIVNLHYKPEKIMNHFGTDVFYIYENNLLGEEGTIKSVIERIGHDYCVVINGDTLTNMNLDKMFRLSQGQSIKFMDGETYAGVRILEPHYTEEIKSAEYQDPGAWWCDMGSFKGLRRARKEYEKFINLSGVLSEGN